MPVDYRRDDQRRRLRFTVLNPVTIEEAVAVLERQLADGAWHYGVVVDLRRGILSAQDADSLVDPVRGLVAQHGPHGPMALVASEPWSFSRSQRYAIRSDEARLRVQVFEAVDAAEAWLDAMLTGEDPTIDVRLTKTGMVKRFVIFEAGASGWLSVDPDHHGKIAPLGSRLEAVARRGAYDAEIARLIEEGWTLLL